MKSEVLDWWVWILAATFVLGALFLAPYLLLFLPVIAWALDTVYTLEMMVAIQERGDFVQNDGYLRW